MPELLLLRFLRTVPATSLIALALASCTRVTLMPNSGDAAEVTPNVPSLIVRGLHGKGLVLETREGHAISPDEDSRIALTELRVAEARHMRVRHQPIAPAQVCRLRQEGVDVLVTCEDGDHRPCVTLTELQASQYSPTLKFSIDAAISESNYITSLTPVRESQVWMSASGGRVFEVNIDTQEHREVLDLQDQVPHVSVEYLLAFRASPDFDNNRTAYGLYAALNPVNFHIFLSEFVFSEEEQRFTLTRELIAFDSTTSSHASHAGGDIAFDSEGYLYASFGDGPLENTPSISRLDLDHLRGKVVRLNVAPGEPLIPLDNPFVHLDPETTRHEIFALGFRNPFRMSYDPEQDALWLGDVGAHSWEEINLVEAGHSYGWPLVEGPECFSAYPSCEAERFTPPVYSYNHRRGKSVTGGRVLRSPALEQLDGFYVFGDFVTGEIMAFDPATADTAPVIPLSLTRVAGVTDFAQLEDGRLLALNAAGEVYLIEDSGGVPGDGIPGQLADTGCFDELGELSSGFSQYDVAAPFWSDGLDKRRSVFVPSHSTVRVLPQGKLSFPEGTVLIKEFVSGGRTVETRLLWRTIEGTWRAATYAHRGPVGAQRVTEGAEVPLEDGSVWSVPPETSCFECHTEAAEIVLGAELAQLDREVSWRNRNLDQLQLWADLGYLGANVPDAWSTPAMALDSGDLEHDARSYLHSNCSGCHRPGAGGRARIDLRYFTPLTNTRTCDVPPELHDLGIAQPFLIAPGVPERSVLLARMEHSAEHRMPPVGVSRRDRQGLRLVSDWIQSLSSCE